MLDLGAGGAEPLLGQHGGTYLGPRDTAPQPPLLRRVAQETAAGIISDCLFPCLSFALRACLEEGALEPYLLNLLFLLTSLLFLSSLLGIYYNIAFGHGSQMMMLRKSEPDLCRDLYGSACRMILDKVKATQEAPFWSPMRSAFLDRMDALGTFLSSALARKHPVSRLLATVYESCLVERDLHAPTTLLRELLTDVGLASWPVVEGDVAQTLQVVDASLRIYGLPSLVSIWVGEDVWNSKKPCIYVNEPQLLLPRAKHLRTQQFPGASRTYQSYVREFVGPFTLNRTMSADALAESLVSFEAFIAHQLPNHTPNYDANPTSGWRNLTISTLADDTWMSILTRVFTHKNNSLDEIPVVVFSAKYMRFLGTLIRNGLLDLVNYVGWRLIERFGWAASDSLAGLRQEFLLEVSPAMAATGYVEVDCAVQAAHLLPFTAGRIFRFSLTVLDPRVPGLVESTVKSLKLALTVLLQNTPWIDNVTTSRAISKSSCVLRWHPAENEDSQSVPPPIFDEKVKADQMMSHLGKFRKVFGCKENASCPFWRLEELY
ncbi:hypothetical protein HPB47_004487 [Ixodes persulcatus]|uniref:Uncharacterized protein n=1 Tax=Ixodes persulcatus TaxID=34615 RepID=A0AC60PFQ2_IXOPE|nr:hypothetical protein HPB47_004487 [Ixodes persulcatus]